MIYQLQPDPPCSVMQLVFQQIEDKKQKKQRIFTRDNLRDN